MGVYPGEGYVKSCQEPWTEAGGELLDLLLAIAGWVARMESNRRSERTKAGLQRPLARVRGWVGLREARIGRNGRDEDISPGGLSKLTG